MSYFARKKTKRELLKEFGDEDSSFGNALAAYLNQIQGAEVTAVIVEGGDVTFVLKSVTKRDEPTSHMTTVKR